MSENNYKSGPSPMIVEQAEKTYAYIMANAGSCNPIPCKLACQRAIYFIYHVEVDGYDAKKDKDNWTQKNNNGG